MSTTRRYITLTVIITLVALSLSACRTRSRVTPTVQPPVTDTAPTQVPQVTAVDPQDDFVRDAGVVTEELPRNLTELNRMAHERGWIRDAFFAFDAFTLDADAQDALTMSASWLRANPQYGLRIEGHTDERGTEQYNLALGERRAHTAREYLVRLGIDSNRISTVSYGEERPFAIGSNEAAWAQNRRAHLVLIERR
jgi:peptidoglycan-associated lipoprotein